MQGIKRVGKLGILGALNAGRDLLPSWAEQRLFRLLGIEFRPPLNSIVYPNGASSAFSVSVDFDAIRPERIRPNSEGTKNLLEVSKAYGIPVTWAICGNTAVNDWDSFQRIADSSVKQEIAIHTFSHRDVSRCSAAELVEEVEMCKKVLGLHDQPRTFIFPWNREGHFDTLRRLGFIAYRGEKRVLSSPLRNGGLWNVPPVLYMGPSFQRNVKRSVGVARKLLDLCVAHGCTFHLWTHPWEISSKDGVDAILSYASDLASEGRVWMCTLGELGGFWELSSHK